MILQNRGWIIWSFITCITSIPLSILCHSLLQPEYKIWNFHFDGECCMPINLVISYFQCFALDLDGQDIFLFLSMVVENGPGLVYRCFCFILVPSEILINLLFLQNYIQLKSSTSSFLLWYYKQTYSSMPSFTHDYALCCTSEYKGSFSLTYQRMECPTYILSNNDLFHSQPADFLVSLIVYCMILL